MSRVVASAMPSSKEVRPVDKKAKTPKKPKQNKPKDAAKGK